MTYDCHSLISQQQVVLSSEVRAVLRGSQIELDRCCLPEVSQGKLYFIIIFYYLLLSFIIFYYFLLSFIFYHYTFKAAWRPSAFRVVGEQKLSDLVTPGTQSSLFAKITFNYHSDDNLIQ
jgi:hypothetical protein